MKISLKKNTENSVLRHPVPSARRHDMRMLLYVTLLVLDSLAVAGAFQLGVLARYGTVGWLAPMDIVVVTLPLYIISAFNNGAYSIDALRRPSFSIVRSSTALLFAFASFLFISYYFRILQVESRLAISIGMGGSFLVLLVFRIIVDQAIRFTIGRRLTSDMVILDEVKLSISPYYHVVDAHIADLRPNARDPMMLDRLAQHLRRIDRVIIACKPEKERAWAMLLKGAGIHGEIISSEFDQIGAIGMNSFEGRSTLVVAAGPLSTRNRIIKRVFDLAFAVPALIGLLPLLVIIALAIKLDSPGPVFFRQQRVGRGNALFKVFKFRSMRVEASDSNGAVSASRTDDRVTRVGKIIRATSMDELPQLLNVLFGSMSIVGPRPHALGSLAGQQLFWDVDERYWHRHALKPGITGLAQVRGFRGATHERDDLVKRLQADLEYILGWSVMRDFRIVVATLGVVVHRNAF